jgi:hypothetical protein
MDVCSSFSHGDIATHPTKFDGENGEAHYREALALAKSRC